MREKTPLILKDPRPITVITYLAHTASESSTRVATSFSCLLIVVVDTAERHIPKCKNTFNRPKPPKAVMNETGRVGLENKSQQSRISKRPSSQLSLEENEASTQNESSRETGSKTLFRVTRGSDQRKRLYSNQQQRPKAVSSLRKNIQSQGMAHPSTSKYSFSILYINSLTANDYGESVGMRKTRNDFVQERTNKENAFVSLSPKNWFRKTIISEPLPKKENLLKNYQGVHSNAATNPTTECPHCMRNFAPRAAERHMPICKNLKFTRAMKPVIENGKIVPQKTTYGGSGFQFPGKYLKLYFND